MLDALNIVEINKLMWSDNTDFVAGQLVHLINMALDQVAPVKKIQIRNRYAPYISESTKVLMKERDSAKYTFLKSQSGVDKKKYAVIRNKVLKIQRQEKKMWIDRMLGEDGKNAKKNMENCQNSEW